MRTDTTKLTDAFRDYANALRVFRQVSDLEFSVKQPFY